MKRLSALFTLLVVCFCSQPAGAQTADWVSIPLEQEQLAVQLPKNHEVKTRKLDFDRFKLDARIYTATSGGVDYSFWSLINEGVNEGAKEGDAVNEEAVKNDVAAREAYLDGCADLVWESFLKPRRDQIPEDSELETSMTYERELRASDELFGREYSIMIGGKPGLTRFFVSGRKIYVLIALNEDADSAAARRFVDSLGPKTPVTPATPVLPVATTLMPDRVLMPPNTSAGSGSGVGLGVGPGRGGNMGGGDRVLPGSGPAPANSGTDYSRVFTGKEVDQKTRVLSKPEPTYTEGARKYSVTGTVILRAVFDNSGQITTIRVVRRLPHGLTEKTIAAAKEIKFIPAQKDGHPVSMWLQLEYNFNLY